MCNERKFLCPKCKTISIFPGLENDTERVNEIKDIEKEIKQLSQEQKIKEKEFAKVTELKEQNSFHLMFESIRLQQKISMLIAQKSTYLDKHNYIKCPVCNYKHYITIEKEL